MKKIELSSQVSEGFPHEVGLDGNRTKQILINLISNAVKYTKVGYVRVQTKIHNGRIVVAVRDSGVGIERNRLKKLFTPFTKIMRHRELNQEGVGLGLVVSRNLA